jgi:deazaflavin-dependent oxidoreductase (nitroreductase family)
MKTPSGTKGAKQPWMPQFLTRLMSRLLEWQHRRKGDTFMGMDLLYLTTVGAKSGEKRRNPVARFEDGDGWLIVASLAGAAQNPAWYHNLVAHPDQVWAEVGGTTHRVVPEQLDGPGREEPWKRITAEQPRYADYQSKTDRVLPVIRLTQVKGSQG